MRLFVLLSYIASHSLKISINKEHKMALGEAHHPNSKPEVLTSEFSSWPKRIA
jgi:hypothetical protein